MTYKEIIELYEKQQFDELKDLLKESEISEICTQLAKIEKPLLLQIFSKLPSKYTPEIFIGFDKTLQDYLVENLSDVDFDAFSEKLLDVDEVETKIDKDTFNEILIRAQSESRHEKLIQIIDDIENKKFSNLKPILKEMEPVDIADIINDIDKEKVAVIFRLLPKDIASDVFVEMDNDAQQVVIESFTDKELAYIIDDLFIDDTTDIIEEMPSNVARRILKVASPENRETINKLLGFPKDSAGSIMTPECITLREHMTVDEALQKMRKQALDKETIYTCYVTDPKKTLLGIVSAKDILLHEPTDIIGDFMQENVIFASSSTDKEEVANLLAKYDLLAIPIVDSENRILGIVTIDDAIDVIKDEASKDINKIAAITPTNKPYLQTSPFAIFKNRIPWLLILLFSTTFTGLIINIYEGTLNKLSPLLFACIPMLMGTGGNSGGQASVTIIQAISTDDVKFRDVFKVLWKEFRVSLLVASVLAVACFVKLELIDNLIFGYNYTIKISIVVSLSLFITVCAAKLIGCFLPLLAKKMKLDPTVVANPFITTIIDIISLLVFCMVSVSIL